MQIDLTEGELQLLSTIVEDFSVRQKKYCFLYSTQIDLLDSLLDKLVNGLNV